MGILDLDQQSNALTLRPGPGEEATSLPATFGDTFGAEWNAGRLFSQSIAGGNAQAAAFDDYLDEVKRASGEDISRKVYSRSDMMAAAQEEVAKLKVANPSLDIPDLTDDELDRRAVARSQEARGGLAETMGRPRTFGASVGAFAGGAAAAATDPINLIGLAVAPEAELPVLASALRWGGIAGVSQAAIEGIGAPFHEAVQPGYLQSGEPLANIAETALSGFVLGGATKALGNAWTRFKTGTWPTSVRDAGNVIESEANIEQSNVLPGVEGGAAHRAALSDAIDSIVKGEPVNVDNVGITPAPLENVRAEAAAKLEAAAASRAPMAGTVQPELPFTATAKEAEAETATAALRNGISQVAAEGGHFLSPEEVATIADRMAKMTPDEAAAATRELKVAPSQLLEKPRAPTPENLEISELTPKAMSETLASPAHTEAMQANLERIRDTGTGPKMIPVGVDERGEPKYQLLDAAMKDAEDDREAADHIESCVTAPVAEAAE